MIVLLWISLLLFPIVIGGGILTIAYGKKNTYKITLSESILLGIIACIGAAEAVHVLGLMKHLSLSTCGKIWGILLLALGVVSVIGMIFLCKNKKERLFAFKGATLEYSMVPFLFVGLLLFQALFVFCTKPIAIAGDITMETVQSFLNEDGIYKVMPLTGRPNENLIPMRYSVLSLPTVYSMLSQLFGQDPGLVVYHVVPVLVMIVVYFSYYHLSGVLFGMKALKKRYLFLVIVALLILFFDGSFASNGFGVLHGGYLGTTVRNMVLVPYVVAVSLQKQWWKAVLCILAEACIVWTFWGLGVCVVVVLGMAVLTGLEKKKGKVHKIFQIFRDEGDLA